MLLTTFLITITHAYTTGNITCELGQYLDTEGNCNLCESGYFCPVFITHLECPENTFSFDGEITCRECGCKENQCQKGNEIDYMNKNIKFAGSCEGESPCKPGFGYIPFTKQCIRCPTGFISSGGNSTCIYALARDGDKNIPVKNLTNHYFLY